MGLAVFFVLMLLLAPYVIGIWAHIRASRLEELTRKQSAEIKTLREQLAIMQPTEPAGDSDASQPAPAIVEISLKAEDVPGELAVSHEDSSAQLSDSDQPSPATDAVKPPQPSRQSYWQRLSQGGLERQFGTILPVWIGGIAIAFAGFFLVKYSIDNNLLGPELRVGLGGILGLALLSGAWAVSERMAAPELQRIHQALAGAGIAVLYIAVYAGTALYDLFPAVLGFVGMAGITVLAVIMALRHGIAIALLGMVGGFLTPALFASGDASPMLFFAYLYFILAALMSIIYLRGWWILSWPAVLFAFGWVLTWIFSGASGEGGDNLWLGLFLLAVAATIVTASRERYESELSDVEGWRDLFNRHNRTIILNVVTIAGAMGLMAILAFDASFGMMEWGLFALLAVGAVALGFFDPRSYGFAPWAAMAINAIMLAGWSSGDDGQLITLLAGFGALYVTSGFLLLTSASAPLLWAVLSAVSALGYFLIAFFRLVPTGPVSPVPHPIDAPVNREPVEPLVEGIKSVGASIPHLWAVLAMGLALAFLAAAIWAARRLPASFAKERILAVYALAATAFLALTFFIELDREFLSVAIAAELLAVAWVASHTQIATLRPIAGLLGLTFGFLLLPQILLLFQLSAYSLLGVEWHVQESVPIVDYPFFQLALPAGMFLLAAYILRREADSWLVRTLEFSALALSALWGFYTTAQLFHPGEDVLFAETSFLERAILTNVLFAYGVVCLLIARFYSRIAFFQAGVLMAGAALFRIVYLDLIMKNPVWFGGAVAGPIPFDALTLAFLVPILWSWLAAEEITRVAISNRLLKFTKFLYGMPFLFAFVWLSLTVRKAFHGANLDTGFSSDAEFYSYSVAWLLFGLAVLFYGTLRNNQILRYTSLAVILMTITKVFLLDADHLTGLYRVMSFLGLGISLLGISYFYSRFVFVRIEGQDGHDDPQGEGRFA